MGKKPPRAKLRFKCAIKQYMESQGQRPLKVKNVPLELEVKNPAPGSKPRNPANHPWRYTGQAKGRIFKDIDPVPFDHKVDVPYGVCFNCWKYGHQQGNCSRPTLNDHCQNCGRIGVKVHNCPRCRRAYLVYHKKIKIQNSRDTETPSVEKQQNKVGKSQDHKVAQSLITEDEYFSYDECDDYSEIIVDEGIQSTVVTDEFLENFLNLINAMMFLPIQEKTTVAEKYLSDHRRRVRQESFES